MPSSTSVKPIAKIQNEANARGHASPSPATLNLRAAARNGSSDHHTDCISRTLNGLLRSITEKCKTNPDEDGTPISARQNPHAPCTSQIWPAGPGSKLLFGLVKGTREVLNRLGLRLEANQAQSHSSGHCFSCRTVN